MLQLISYPMDAYLVVAGWLSMLIITCVILIKGNTISKKKTKKHPMDD